MAKINLWTNHQDGAYSVEQSTLHDREFQCPCCEHWLYLSEFTLHHDPEGELIRWQGECPKCDSLLLIFND